MTRTSQGSKIKIFNAVVLIGSAISLTWSREYIGIFLVAMVAAFLCSMIVCVIPIHVKKMKTELEQYSDLLKHGIPVSGKITFSDDSTLHQDDTYRVEGELRYRLKDEEKDTVNEIIKTTTTTRSYDPKAGAVESVKLIVLPGSPKSAIEASHAKNEIERIERIEKDLVKLQCYLPLCIVLGAIAWPLAIQKAMEEERLGVLWSQLCMYVLLILIGLASMALRIKPQSKNYFIFVVVSMTFCEPARLGLILMRVGNSVSPWRFVIAGLYTTWLLYTIAQHLRPGQRTLLIPLMV